MKYIGIICISCKGDFVLGQAMTWAVFTTIGGPGGDYIDDRKWLIHNRPECKDIAEEYERKNNWPGVLQSS